MSTNIEMVDVTKSHIKIIRNAETLYGSCIQSFTDREGTTIEVHYHDADFVRMVSSELLSAADSLEGESCE